MSNLMEAFAAILVVGMVWFLYRLDATERRMVRMEFLLAKIAENTAAAVPAHLRDG